MMRRGLSIAIVLFASAPALFAQQSTKTFTVAGVSRNFIQYVPTGLAAKPPLVFVIHGFNMTGQQEVGLTKMNQVADREKFLVVYPNALPDTGNQPSWNLGSGNDYTYLLAIIDSMGARYDIDRNRVYASGFSQGGFLSFQLGCRYADKFAAIAPVSGLLNGSCNPKRPVPMIFTYGTNEGFDVNGFVQSGEKWVQLNACTGTPNVAKPYPPTNTRSVVTRTTYSSCKEGAEVTIQSVEGGTHEWPMNTTTKVNNSEEVWAFFKRFSLAGSSSIPGSGLPAARSPSGPPAIYLDGRVRLPGAAEGSRVRVFDTRGRLAATSAIAHGEFIFAGKPGVYRIQVDGAGERSARMVVP